MRIEKIKPATSSPLRPAVCVMRKTTIPKNGRQTATNAQNLLVRLRTTNRPMDITPKRAIITISWISRTFKQFIWALLISKFMSKRTISQLFCRDDSQPMATFCFEPGLMIWLIPIRNTPKSNRAAKPPVLRSHFSRRSVFSAIDNRLFVAIGFSSNARNDLFELQRGFTTLYVNGVLIRKRGTPAPPRSSMIFSYLMVLLLQHIFPNHFPP